MKKTFSVILCLVFSATASAKDWISLFDGKTLSGWNSWKTKSALVEGAWKAEEGSLSLTGKGGGDIYTAEAFENYEFEVEWKTTGNSGILLRVDPGSTGAIWHRAPEMQVDKGNPDALKSTSAGGLYALYDFTEKKVFDPNGWNMVKIRCENHRFQIWFNGKKAHDFTVGSEDWKSRVAKSKFRKYPGFGETKLGHIGFQDHGARVQYRNIRIRKL